MTDKSRRTDVRSCGCKLIIDSLQNEDLSLHIESEFYYCDMHAAADKLLDFAKEFVAWTMRKEFTDLTLVLGVPKLRVMNKMKALGMAVIAAAGATPPNSDARWISSKYWTCGNRCEDYPGQGFAIFPGQDPDCPHCGTKRPRFMPEGVG